MEITHADMYKKIETFYSKTNSNCGIIPENFFEIDDIYSCNQINPKVFTKSTVKKFYDPCRDKSKK